MPTESCLRQSLCATALGLLLSAASAQESPDEPVSPWSLQAQTSVHYERNLLRLSIDEPTPAGFSRDDTVSHNSLAVALDQRLGLQRLRAQASMSESRFARNPRYDHEGYGGQMLLGLAVATMLSGQLSVGTGRQLSLVNHEALGVLPERNLQTRHDLGGLLRVALPGRWALELSGEDRQLNHSLNVDVARSRDHDRRSRAAELAWTAGPSLDLRLGSRRSETLYPRFLTGSGRADQVQAEALTASARWQASAASTLQAGVSREDFAHAEGKSRDVAVNTAELSWRWQPRARFWTRLRWSQSGSLESFPDPQGRTPVGLPDVLSFHRSQQGLNLRLDWLASSKLSVRLELERYQRDIDRLRLLTANMALQDRVRGHDHNRLATLAAAWSPWRWLHTDCELYADRRMSDRVASNSINLGLARCTLRLRLQ